MCAAVSLCSAIFLTFARIVLVPLWLVLASGPSSFGDNHDACAYAGMVVLSVSNGFLASLSVSVFCFVRADDVYACLGSQAVTTYM
jgi:hypothetical protein